MPTLSGTSLVNEIVAADPKSAKEHFERILSFETDCWDVHTAIAARCVDFVLLDVRSPGLYAAGHLPGAINLPSPRTNQ